MFLHLANAAIQKMIVSRDPWYFLWVLGNTLWTKQDFFITSSIGQLGWLDIQLPSILYYGMIFVLGMLVLKTARKGKQLSFAVLIMLTGIMLATGIGIMYFFYLNGTAVASPIVDALQGRYLLPVIPFVFFLLIEWVAVGLEHKRLSLCIGAAVFILLIGQSIYFRYYDYSKVFDTADILTPLEKDMQGTMEFPVTVVNNKQSFVYDVRFPGYKIGGFQIAVLVDPQKYVNVPYQYELKDASCKKTIRRGYFDETELHRPHIYTQLLPITPILSDRVCLEITPLYGTIDVRYLPLVTKDSKPIVNFLYIKK